MRTLILAALLAIPAPALAGGYSVTTVTTQQAVYTPPPTIQFVQVQTGGHCYGGGANVQAIAINTQPAKFRASSQTRANVQAQSGGGGGDIIIQNSRNVRIRGGRR